MTCSVMPNGYLAIHIDPQAADQYLNVIELGGGLVPQFHPNVDVRHCFDAQGETTVDFTADFGAPLPIKSSEWDVVFSRYAIEHVSWRQIPTFVSEIYRILKPGGIAMIVTANGEAQMRWALAQPEWDERISQCLCGDLDYPENGHKVLFNPSWAMRLFRKAGFSRVITHPHGELDTDMVIEARK